MSRRRSAAVSVSLVAALSVAMTGCGSSDDDPDYRGVCVDKSTQKRVDDKQCDNNGGGGGRSSFVYFPRGATVPPVGSAVHGGSAAAPKGASVARGGFGGGAHGGSVGG